MLYGITELDFGAGTNICFLEDDAYEKFDALPEQYTKSGYRAEMLHGYNDSLYNRTVTYPRLGFSDLLFSADIQALDFPWEGGIYGGYYMRDSYFFQAMLDRMEDINSSGEPTIVVFFGDHRPNLFMTDGDTVYTKLGLCPDNDTVGWTPEEISDLYSTDYLIWANDAALLQGQAGTRRDSSITAIGPQLLELTGQPVTRYWALLEKVSQVCLTNTELYFVDGTGTPSAGVEEAALSDEARELLQLREDVLYDAMYGQQYITAEMNEPVQ